MKYLSFFIFIVMFLSTLKVWSEADIQAWQGSKVELDSLGQISQVGSIVTLTENQKESFLEILGDKRLKPSKKDVGLNLWFKLILRKTSPLMEFCSVLVAVSLK